MDAVLDTDVVEQLRALAAGSGSDLLKKLQAAFARDTPPRLAALRLAVSAGDAEAIAFNLHTLSGSAANLGAHQIVATCSEIQRFPGTPSTGALEPLLAQLERNAVDAHAALARLAG